MSQKLKFVVLNSQIVCIDAPIQVNGETITGQFKRTALEALPDDGFGKTFSAILPAEAAEQFPEGTVINVTIDVAEPVEVES